ncbi:putative protein isoform X2 [Gossypium australe]|uniref:Uncharacterized protein n=1 Tax=Gossypium australe TaxID=47621 RepID=A0A5B6VS20_9ROSI|nr:putative protein isoform X2 [Gossypium australe]
MAPYLPANFPIRAKMSSVNSPSFDVGYDFDNFLNDSTPPAADHIFKETSTSAGNHDTLIHAPIMNTATMLLTQHGVTPATNSMNFQGGEFSVGNLKPHMMIHASMMNTATMVLTQHGVTPATNSMNFQEVGFSVGNLESYSCQDEHR